MQRNPTERGVSEYDREASVMRPLAAVAPWEKKDTDGDRKLTRRAETVSTVLHPVEQRKIQTDRQTEIF